MVVASLIAEQLIEQFSIAGPRPCGKASFVPSEKGDILLLRKNRIPLSCFIRSLNTDFPPSLTSYV